MTGQWEKRLHDIANGKEDYQAFVSAMEQTVREWYSAVVSSADTEKYVSDEATLSCPFCGERSSKVNSAISVLNSAISVLQRKIQAVLFLSAMRFAEKPFPMHRL